MATVFLVIWWQHLVLHAFNSHMTYDECRTTIRTEQALASYTPDGAGPADMEYSCEAFEDSRQ